MSVRRFALACTLIVILTGCSLWKKETPETVRNPELPGSAVSAEDQTAYNAAIQARDKTLCVQIKDELQRQRCTDDITFQEASLSQDTAACDAISDAVEKQGCIDTIYFNTAGEKRDEKICLQIKNEEQQKLCVANVEGLKTMRLPE